ncbi:centrosomal protein of 162 kDa isoform X1 [Arapaima gigas]
MSRRLTKEELDEQFEQFLKESISDDSVDLGSAKCPSVLDSLGKAVQKPVKTLNASQPWWREDSEDSVGKDVERRAKFTKAGKALAGAETLGSNLVVGEQKEENRVRQSPPYAFSLSTYICNLCMAALTRPTPRPRSKALERFSQLEKFHRDKLEVSHDALEGPILEKQHFHEALGQKSSALEDSNFTLVETSNSSSHSDEDGLSASGKIFLKSLEKSLPIQEEDEEIAKSRYHEEQQKEDEEEKQGTESVIFSRDSLEPEESVMASGPGLNLTGFGLHTLDEEEEKARFFANLERGASSTIDYSRLNRELDSTGSTQGTTLRRAEQIMTELEEKTGTPELRNSSASLNYSEDFEDEIHGKEEGKEERSGPAMLEKVSLHDSLDSTGGAEQLGLGHESMEDTAKKDEWAQSRNIEASGTAQSHSQTGNSEMEAVQEAYRQIRLSMSDSVGYPHNTTLPGDAQNSSPPALNHTRGMLKTTVSTGSDLPTAEELMQPIRPEFDFSQRFAFKSNSRGEVQASQMLLDELSEDRSSSAPKTVSASQENDGMEDDRARKVTEEVECLMQYVDDTPHFSPAFSRDKEKQVSEQSSNLHGGGARLFLSRKKSNPPVVKSKRAMSAWLPGVNRTSSATKPLSSSLAKRSPVSQGSKKRTTSEAMQKGNILCSKTGKVGNTPGSLTGGKGGDTLTLLPAGKEDKTPGSLTSGKGDPNSQANPGLTVSKDLIASLQSFTTFLQQQTEGTGTHDPAGAWPAVNKTSLPENTPSSVTFPSNPKTRSRDAVPPEHEKSAGDKLLMDVEHQQLAHRDQELLHTLSNEVTVLKQENYVLKAKLHKLEEVMKKKRWSIGESLDPLTEEKLRVIEKEVTEQETIIQGYHQENEKLYKQVKALQAQAKVNEEAMFMENQALRAELAACRELVSRNNVQRVVGHVLEPGQKQGTSDLLTQVQALQKNETRLMEETRRLKQEKQALDVDLEVMKKERDLAKAQVIYSSGDKTFEMKMLEERHQEELLALNKKLQWYAENQELLDRDAARLRAATDEAQRLKEQVEKLKSELKNGQQQRKVKERAGDAKRILDLERQVKEMEEILRRRHPNSLPALILAAAAADPGTPDSARTVAFLERRVQRLEAELEGRDEEAKRSLRTMEQQYHRIKIQYEQQISQLEQQLAMKPQQTQAVSPQACESKAQVLEEELVLLQETQKNRENALQTEIGALKKQLQQATSKEDKPRKSPTRHERQVEEAQGVRIDRLSQELAAKSKMIQELTRVVERLQRERRSLFLVPRPQGPSRETRRPETARGTPALQGEEQGGMKSEVRPQTFPPTLDEKNYQPSAFSGSHISEVLQENEQLKARLEQVKLEAEHERVRLQAAVTHAEDELQRVQESVVEQLSSLKAKHQRELEDTLTRHALEHSSSKVAELTNQLATQEIMVRHLQDQVKELQGCKEALAVSQVREETLQKEMAKLLEELKEAKEAHTPTLKHFISLERKIKNMELRHMQRERELQQVVTQTRLVPEQQQKEAEGWRRLAQAKNRELEAFRLELDSILDVLRELQRHNAILPTQPP